MHLFVGICVFVTWAAVGAVGMYPQGYNVSFYFRSCSLSGRLANGMCCDVNRNTNCPAHCDVHFVVCIREHNETSDYCNSQTSSHVTFLHYAYLDVRNLTFFEGENVFGVGLHNPLVYAFAGNWTKRIQTVLIARDFDFEYGYSFQNIDYIDVNWTVAAGGPEDGRTFVGAYMNMVVRLGLKVECWDGWYGDYCTAFCVPRDDTAGHYTCNADGVKECLFGWTGITCNTSVTTCSPPCATNRRCYGARCDLCADGYSGANCTCVPATGCDPTGGFCQGPMECRCHTGYYGANCEELNYCARWGNPCLNSGMCLSTSNGSYSCQCATGFAGYRCGLMACPNTGCSVLPCNNGGACRNVTSGTSCECPNGYTGPCCDVVVNNCVNNPCQHGSCTNSIGDYICDCDTGYQGQNCSTDTDECSGVSPCQNSATCSNLPGHYFCHCPLNYTGVNCSQHLTSCGSVVCEGGECACQCAPQCEQGRCANTVASGPPVYRCVCIPGFNGTACDNNIEDCRGQCEHGGVCVDRVDGYTCRCPDGYTGERCEVDVVECDSSPCENGGTCTNTMGSYACMCQPAFTGHNCDTFTQLGYCAMNNSCENGGECRDEMFGTSCECSSEYNGTLCEYRIDPCEEISCINGGVCEEGRCQCPDHYSGEDCSQVVDVCGTQVLPSDCPSDKGTCHNTPNTSSGYVCRCNAGYNGAKCENDINECAGNPCGSNGACTDLINSFECECTAGYSGELCDQIIDNCESSPCLNSGTCENKVNTFSCECPGGTLPPVCQLTENCNRTSCSNHGDCEIQASDVGVASCECDKGYTGQFCENLVNLCDSSPCTLGATCYQGIDSYLCKCEAGIADTDCTDQISSSTGAGSSYELLPVILGVLVGVLATLVVVLSVAMTCYFLNRRKRRSEGHTRYVDAQVLDAGIASNPVYDGLTDLPSYTEIRGQGDTVKVPLGGTGDNIYEGVSELKKEILADYGMANPCFEDVAAEKRALEEKFSAGVNPVSELKRDILADYGMANQGFEDVAEEKMALDAVYENLK